MVRAKGAKDTIDLLYQFPGGASWGGNNPDVHESELCRIFQLISVRAPIDR
jgi:hypothetical protein